MARLKVFSAQMGFHEAVVAVPSQKAALAAWGSHQNLFAEGQARVTDDPAAVAAALGRPGVVLRRPIGGGGPFEDASAPPRALPKLPDLPRPKAQAKRAAKPTPTPPPAPPPPPPRPPPDRSKLSAAEKALADAEADYRRARADLERKAAEIVEARDRLDREHDAEATRLIDRLEAARAEYRRAGGAP
jgi:hypothetical protein